MKLESKELRIGNFIENTDSQMASYMVVNADVIKQNEHTMYASLEPIPLTEEWLLKFGFTKHGKYSYFYKDDLIIDKNDLGVFFMCDIDIHVEIKSVHQLQNLHWCLFGEELTLKP
jgi:hypothetical protein